MKAIKIIASVLGILLLIAATAAVLLITFVSPNRFKPLITEQVKKSTGRDLVIDGDLSWTLFPSLGVKIGHLTFDNPAGFKQKTFAEIQSATVEVKVMPLIHKKIESDGITLTGLKLYLIKNADGKTNWQDLQKNSPTDSEKESITPQKIALGIMVNGIDIKDGEVSWINEQAKQTFNIEHLTVHAKNINLTHPFSVVTAFNFDGKNPDTSGKVSLASQIGINLDKQTVAFHDLDFSADVNQDAKQMSFKLKGDGLFDINNQTLQLQNLQGNMGELKFLGKMNITDLSSQPKTTGHIQIPAFNAKNWLKNTGYDVASLQTFKNLSGDFDFSLQNSLKSVNLQGTFKIDEVKAAKALITNINVHTQLQNGILEFSPMRADFYQGTLQGQTKVNLTTKTPLIAINAKLTNVQAQPLLTDLTNSTRLKLTGTGNVDLQVATSGSSGDAILKNLNGTSRLVFSNGTLQGIDLGYLVDSAYALANKQSVSGSNSGQTSFGSMTANATIRNGVISNNDLTLDSPRFDTTGYGKINLVNQQINYHLQTSVKKTGERQANTLLNMYGLPIPILIAGDLSNPSITMDTSALMKAIATQQLQKAKSQIQNKIQDKIKDEIHGKAGELLNSILGQ